MFKRVLNHIGRAGTLSTVRNISAAELRERLDNGETPYLLDVRSAVEFQYDGHIPGAHLLPLQALRQRLPELPQDQTIVCVCHSGQRSQAACEQLVAAGFQDVVNLSGGMIGWQMAPRPPR